MLTPGQNTAVSCTSVQHLQIPVLDYPNLISCMDRKEGLKVIPLLKEELAVDGY